MAERQCPRCGRPQPETSTQGKCLFCGAELPPAAAAPPPPPPVAQNPPPSEAGEPDKRPCPRCGESLYYTEKRCWRCGYEFGETPQAPTEPPPAEAPAPDETPTAAPPAASPAAVAPPPIVPPSVPYYPSTFAPAASADQKQAQVLGIWAFVTGILGIFCCFGVAPIAAIYLGVRSNRLARNGLATAGIVLGIVGIIEFLALVGLGLFGYFLEKSQSIEESAILPALHCVMAIARPFLGL